MAWNPSPVIGNANWFGNSGVATRNQLLSTSTGLIETIENANFSTISLSTLTVPQWISTSALYVSDLRAQNIELSGVYLDSSGVFAVNYISSAVGSFSLVQLSSVGVTITNNLKPEFNLTIDLGFGEMVGGALAGLGAIVGGAFAGVGAIVGGAETGLATLINPRDQTFINNNHFETINTGTQIQVSTLGDAYPAYSSILRLVSSSGAGNIVPGQEIFVSSIFYPGQVCIRSLSDPYSIITADPNVATSTIQSFGEWVPLIDSTKNDLTVNSLSTNTISTGAIVTNYIVGLNGGVQTFSSQDLDTRTLTIPDSIPTPGPILNMGYGSPINLRLGSLGNAQIVGDINYLFIQSDQAIQFQGKTGDPGGIPFAATLEMGTGAGESILTISTLNATAGVHAITGNFSTLTVTDLVVLSSLTSYYSTTQINLLSTSVVEADIITANFANISTMAPFQFFSTTLGNPTGTFDISRYDSLVSTTYDQISSLTQNILKYSLNVGIQDEANFNIYNGQSQLALFSVTPANVEQWASTNLIFNTYEVPGQIDLGWVGQWGQTPGQVGGAPPGGATFDVTYTFSNQYANSFLITEQSNNSPTNPGVSTFYNYTGPAGFTGFSTFRFTLPPVVSGTRSGWWQVATPAGPPYATSNNNTFQILQDINDTYIQGTDRLHIQAGDIFFDGNTTFSNINFNTVNAQTVNVQTLSTSQLSLQVGTFSTITTNTETVSTLIAQNLQVNPVQGIDTYFYKPSTFSFNSGQTSVNPLNMQYIVQSPDNQPLYYLLAPFMGSNAFNSYNASQWNGTLWRNNIALVLGPPLVVVGDVQTTQGAYAAKFWIYNNPDSGPDYTLPIIQITTAGSNIVGYVNGASYGLIQTTDGQSWTVSSNVPNPNTLGGNYSNIVNVTQDVYATRVSNTQALSINAPQVNFTTNSLNWNADQIRVNSRRYGAAQTQGIPSFPIGIENTVNIDSNISWTFKGGAYDWGSDAVRTLYNVNNTTLYDYNTWLVQVIPSRFRTNGNFVLEWDVQPGVNAVAGGGYAWVINRWILVNTTLGGPGSGANNWNWVLAIPRNYCTYL